MENANTDAAVIQNRIKIFRWYFYIALVQILLYFIVPAVLFPNRMVIYVEIISALTLGLAVGVFFMLVNILGLFVDKSRRKLYISMLSVIAIWFAWAFISWSYIERMDYLLR